MVSSHPSAGIGSNQYQTKPGGTTPARRDVPASVVAAAFDGDGLKVWRDWQSTDDEIAEWWDTGRSAEEAAWWVSYGCTPDDADLYEQAGITGLTLAWWRHPNHPPWITHPGVPAKVAGTWAAGCPGDPLRFGFEAASFHAGGWTPEDAAPWITAGFSSPAEVDWWRDSGRGDPSAEALVTLWAETDHLLLPFESTSMIQQGTQGVIEYRRCGLFDPVVASRWLRQTNNGRAAVYWHQQGVPVDWAVNASRRWEYANLGMVSDPRLIAGWWHDQKDPETEIAGIEQRDWAANIGFADGFIFEGFTPRDALPWKDEGFYPITAGEWRNAGFSPADTKAWQEAVSPYRVHFPPANQTPLHPLVRLIRDRGGTAEEAGAACAALTKALPFLSR